MSDDRTIAPTATTTGVLEWLTTDDVVSRLRCGPKQIYRAVKTGKLRAARIGDRGDYRFRPQWVDDWLERSATPVEIVSRGRE